MNRKHYLMSNYHITEETYAKVLEFQKGGCAICGRPPKTKSLAVDHDHRTKLNRGLLCDHCNRGLAWFRDNPDTLVKASDYLRNPPFKQLAIGSISLWADAVETAAHDEKPQHLQVFEPAKGETISSVSKSHLPTGTIRKL